MKNTDRYILAEIIKANYEALGFIASTGLVNLDNNNVIVNVCLQKWLFDNHKIGVYAMIVTTGEFIYEVWQQKTPDHWDILTRKRGQENFELAMANGLFFASELLLKENQDDRR